MYERVRKCPNCGANLEASRFARSTPCPFCGSAVLLDPSAVDVARFREARAAWDDPATHGLREASRIGEALWAIGPMIARGETSDVHVGIRARTPSELVLVRLLRAPTPARLDRAWAALRTLHASKAAGASAMLRRIPEPVARGLVEAGPHAGRAALVVRPAHAHPVTLADLRPPVDPRATIWLWRRILEALAFVHGAGLVHGAVLPPHVLLEAGEHGARLVGFGSAGPAGGEAFAEATWRPLLGDGTSRAEDLRASARTILWALGGDPSRGTASVPTPYAAVLRAVASDGVSPQGDADAWSLRERLGSVAEAAFGRPAFCPLVPRGTR